MSNVTDLVPLTHLATLSERAIDYREGLAITIQSLLRFAVNYALPDKEYGALGMIVSGWLTGPVWAEIRSQWVDFKDNLLEDYEKLKSKEEASAKSKGYASAKSKGDASAKSKGGASAKSKGKASAEPKEDPVAQRVKDYLRSKGGSATTGKRDTGSEAVSDIDDGMAWFGAVRAQVSEEFDGEIPPTRDLPPRDVGERSALDLEFSGLVKPLRSIFHEEFKKFCYLIEALLGVHFGVDFRALRSLKTRLEAVLT